VDLRFIKSIRENDKVAIIMPFKNIVEKVIGFTSNVYEIVY